MIPRLTRLPLFLIVYAGLVFGAGDTNAEVWKLQTIVKDSVLSLTVSFSETNKIAIECDGIDQVLRYVRTVSLDAFEQKSIFSGSIRIGKIDFPIEINSTMNGKPFVFSGILFAQKELLQAISNNHHAHIKFPMEDFDFAIDQDQGKTFATQCSKLLKLKLA